MFRTTMLRKAISSITASLLVLGAAACNTVSGAGEDLQSASSTVEEAM